MAEAVRLQKYFSDCGILSRRAAEAEISAGRVLINGIPAVLGDKIDPTKDTVEYRGRIIHPREGKPHRYVMLNKPRGIVCTAKDEKGRRAVTDLVPAPGTKLYPVGRLDMDSEGLLLLTDDGKFANHLTHPRHEIPKIYRVEFAAAPTREQIRALSLPMELDGYRLLPVGVKQVSETEVEMTLYEGRNRQIRRMCQTVGLKIVRLRRIAIGDLRLGTLPLGKWRELKPEEVSYLMEPRSASQAVNERN